MTNATENVIENTGAPVGPDLEGHVRDAHRKFPTGVTIVTTRLDGTPYGLAVNAFSSVSLDPPHVLFCVAQTSSTYPRLFSGDAVAINILAHNQDDVVARFSRSGGDKFESLEWRAGVSGAPVIAGSSAVFEGRIERRIHAFTHTIFVARIEAACSSDTDPIVYLGGKLGVFGREK